MLGWSPHLQVVRDIKLGKGEDLTGTPFQPPELLDGLDFYAEAYSDLKSMRLYDGGPVPYSALRDYADEHEMDAEAFAYFRFLVQAMQKAERAHATEQQARNKPPSTPSPRSR